MATKKNHKTNENIGQGGFLRETLLLTVIAFSILTFVMLCWRDVFGAIGDFIDSFALGVFGYMVFPSLIAVVFFSVLALIDKKLPVKRSSLVLISLTVFFLATLVHFLLDKSGAKGSLSEYISYCFHAAENVDGEVGDSTFFGVVGGLTTYFFSRYLTATGAAVALSFITVTFGYLTVRSFMPRAKKQKRQEKVVLPEEDESEVIIEDPAPKRKNVVRENPKAREAVRAAQERAVQERRVEEPPVSYGENYGDAYVAAHDNAYGERYGQESIPPADEDGLTPYSGYGVSPRPYMPVRPEPIRPYGETSFRSAPVAESREEKDESRNILLKKSSADYYRENLIYDDNSRYNARLTQKKAGTQPAQTGSTEKYPTRPVVGVASPEKEEPKETSYLEDYQRDKDILSDNGKPTVIRDLDDNDLLNDDRTFRRAETRDTFEEEIAPDDFTDEDDDWEEPERNASFDEERRLFGEEDSSSRRLDRFRAEEIEEESPFSGEESRIRGFEESEPLSESRDRFGERTFRREAEGEEETSRFEEGSYDRDDRISREEELRGAFDLRGESRDDFFSDEQGEDYLDQDDESEEFSPVPPAPVYEEEIRAKQSTAKGMGMFGKTDFSVHKEYVRPPLSLFKQYAFTAENDTREQEEHKRIILETLHALVKIQAEIVSVTAGPTFTRYDVKIPSHVPSKRIAACATDIAMALRSKDGVNIFPNLENGTNSIEVPNKKRGLVGLAPLLEGNEYKNAPGNSLIFAIGKDVEGRNIYGKIAKMTHLLVAGATGAGKSVFLNTLILSLIIRYTPQELRLILVDPKQVEFSVYNHMPHLMVNEIISEPIKVIAILNWAIEEMERRYMLFNQMSAGGRLVRNIDEYNEYAKAQDKLPKIVMIVDELADLMLQNKNDIEDKISRLTAKSRACGIHLVLATQRPSVNVITGVIKANLPTRFAFKVSAEVDSRTILDEQGAEKLLGNGDLLYKTSSMFTPMRVQGAFVSSEEVQQVVEYIKDNNEAYFDSAVEEIINRKMSEDSASDESSSGGGAVEPIFIDALRMVVAQGAASISMIQRKFSVGYNKAGRIIEWMEEMGYVSSYDGAKTRKVLLTQEEFDRIYGDNHD